MTVALVLAGSLDEADAGLCGQLAALGVRRVDAAEQTGPGLLTVAAAARAAGERVLICAGADTVPEPVLARLLGAGGTAAFTGVNAGTVPPTRLAARPGRRSRWPAGRWWSTRPTWTRWPSPPNRSRPRTRDPPRSAR